MPPAQFDLPWDQFRTLPLLSPPIDSQRQIASFLDDQVALLDCSIEARRQQRTLVGERYSVALNDLYDCGRFDRTKVPLGRLLARPPCYGVLVPQFVADGVPFCRVNALHALQAGVVPDVSIAPTQSEEFHRTVLAPGDVLTAVVGTLGVSAIVPEGAAGANIARAVARLQPGSQVTSWFLRGYLATNDYLSAAVRATGSGTAQATLNMSDLARFAVGVPQGKESTTSLGKGAQRLLSDRAAAQDLLDVSIRLLQERKQALITAAVTGQFDVSTARRVEV